MANTQTAGKSVADSIVYHPQIKTDTEVYLGVATPMVRRAHSEGGPKVKPMVRRRVSETAGTPLGMHLHLHVHLETQNLKISKKDPVKKVSGLNRRPSGQ